MNSLTPANRLLKFASLVLCLAAFGLALAPQKASAEISVSFEYFEDSLAPYGDWVEIEGYGTCWTPYVEDRDWRPYSDGYWAYTDCGWTWVSEEPWGWATYHYGRWMFLEGPGWVWVPGYEWAPAWVAWRSSDDYIGWAPLPPETCYVPPSGFDIFVDLRFNISPSRYNFCEVRHFGSRRLRDRICRSDRNVTIINKTVNVTKVVYNNSTVYNGGPDIEAVNRRSERRIERLRLERRERDSATLARNAEQRDDRLEVFAPKIEPSGRAAADVSQPKGRRFSRSRADSIKTDAVRSTDEPKTLARRDSDSVQNDSSVVLTPDPAPERLRRERRAQTKPVSEVRQERIKPAQEYQSAPRQRKERVESPAVRVEKAPRQAVREQPEPRTQRSIRAPEPRPDRQEKKAAGQEKVNFQAEKQKQKAFAR